MSCFVAFHYRSYGTFFLQQNRLHNIYRGFTHYKYYRANIYIVPPLAFCMGLVTTAFGEVSGIAYNNAFMTGNIKRTMLAFGDYVRTKHTPFLREGLIFVSLLSSFVLGVVVSAYLSIFYEEKTILGIPIMMSIFYLSMLFANWRKKVGEKA